LRQLGNYLDWYAGRFEAWPLRGVRAEVGPLTLCKQ